MENINNERIEELFGSVGRLASKVGSALDRGGRKMAAGSERKARLKSNKKQRRVAKKEHRKAVKAYAKSLKGGDSKSQSAALKDLRNSRMKHRELRTGKKQKYKPQNFAKDPSIKSKKQLKNKNVVSAHHRSAYRRFAEALEEMRTLGEIYTPSKKRYQPKRKETPDEKDFRIHRHVLQRGVKKGKDKAATEAHKIVQATIGKFKQKKRKETRKPLPQ